MNDSNAEILEEITGIEKFCKNTEVSLKQAENKLPQTTSDDPEYCSILLQAISTNLVKLSQLVDLARKQARHSIAKQIDPSIHTRIVNCMQKTAELKLLKNRLSLHVWLLKLQKAMGTKDPYDPKGMNLARGHALGQAVKTYDAISQQAIIYFLTFQPNETAIADVSKATQSFHQAYAIGQDAFIIQHRKKFGQRILYAHARAHELLFPNKRWGKRSECLNVLPRKNARNIIHQACVDSDINEELLSEERVTEFVNILSTLHRQCDIADKLSIERKLAPNNANAKKYYQCATTIHSATTKLSTLLTDTLCSLVKDTNRHEAISQKMQVHLITTAIQKQISCLNEACHLLLKSGEITTATLKLAYKYLTKEQQAISNIPIDDRNKQIKRVQSYAFKAIWFAQINTEESINYSQKCLAVILEIANKNASFLENNQTHLVLKKALEEFLLAVKLLPLKSRENLSDFLYSSLSFSRTHFPQLTGLFEPRKADPTLLNLAPALLRSPTPKKKKKKKKKHRAKSMQPLLNKLGKRNHKESNMHCYRYKLPLPEQLTKLRTLIAEHGMKLYLNGGAIRSMLLGQPIADFDYLLIGATTKKAAALLEELNPKLQGKTITLKLDGLAVDITCRTNKQGEVKSNFQLLHEFLSGFGFSCNTFAYDAEEGIIYALPNSIEHLRNNLLVPRNSAKEHILTHICRAMKYHCKTGLKFSKSLLKLLSKNEDCFSQIANNTLASQVHNYITSSFAEKFFTVLWEFKHFHHLFPDTEKLSDSLYKSEDYRHYFHTTITRANHDFEESPQKLVFIYSCLLWPCFLQRFNQPCESSYADHFNNAMNETFGIQHNKVFLHYDIQYPIRLLWCQFLQQHHEVDDIFVIGRSSDGDRILRDITHEAFVDMAKQCPIKPELTTPVIRLE